MAATATRRIAIRDMTTGDLRLVRRIERAAYGRALPGTPFERELQNGLAHYFVAVEREDPSPAIQEPSVFGADCFFEGLATPPSSRNGAAAGPSMPGQLPRIARSASLLYWPSTSG